jgi:mono/diheme cytochrome c family protein
MVAEGGAEMPGLAAVLTPEQIDAVSRYVLVELAAALRGGSSKSEPTGREGSPVQERRGEE